MISSALRSAVVAKSAGPLRDTCRFSISPKSRVRRFAAARAAYQQALDIDEAVAREVPSDLSLLRGVSISLSRLANLRATQGDLEGAIATYQRDLDIAERLAASAPADESYQQDLAISSETMGDMLVRKRDFATLAASAR